MSALNEYLDPHYEWVEVISLNDPSPVYQRGRCLHIECEPVETLEGEVVSVVCVTCDQAFWLEEGSRL